MLAGIDGKEGVTDLLNGKSAVRGVVSVSLKIRLMRQKQLRQ